MNTRRLTEVLAGKLMLSATVVLTLITLAIALGLLQRSIPILTTQPLSDLLFSSSWHPWEGKFGFYPFIMGTIWVTLLAMILSAPPGLLTAVYLSEYSVGKVRAVVKPMIDLLAAIPSVVYGLWGVLIVVPFIRDYLAPRVGVTTTGYTVLAGGTVLAIMVLPIIVAISEEVIRAVPQDVREASFALGATKWQTVRHVVLRQGLPGMIVAVTLGFGRAFGETMAVLMVAGNVAKIPSSLFDPAYPIPALIANNYGEMMSIPMYDSALMLAAFLLLLVVLAFSLVAAVVLARIRRSYSIG